MPCSRFIVVDNAVAIEYRLEMVCDVRGLRTTVQTEINWKTVNVFSYFTAVSIELIFFLKTSYTDALSFNFPLTTTSSLNSGAFGKRAINDFWVIFLRISNCVPNQKKPILLNWKRWTDDFCNTSYLNCDMCKHNVECQTIRFYLFIFTHLHAQFF